MTRRHGKRWNNRRSLVTIAAFSIFGWATIIATISVLF